MVKRTTFESYEELLNGCSSSQVKSLVSSILCENRYLDLEKKSMEVIGLSPPSFTLSFFLFFSIDLWYGRAKENGEGHPL